ncbi:MAG: Gfo/Idh/MocA family protein [Candidatus Hodarchaeota archaeon]
MEPASQFPEVEVVAIASREEHRAKEFAEKLGIPQYYGSYDELLENPDINVIYNPTPHGLHGEWSIKSLKAGKHVLCEKPIASNADEARRMKAVADEMGLNLTEAFHYKYHPYTQKMKEILKSGDLGEIEHIEASFGFDGRAMKGSRWQYELSGGSVMDPGCYPVSITRYLCDEEPTVVSATADHVHGDIDGYMAAELEFPCGVTAKIISSMVADRLKENLLVKCSKGVLKAKHPFLPHWGVGFRVLKDDEEKKRIKFKSDTTYHYQLKAFIEAVQQGKPALTSIEDGIANMEVMDEIYRKAGLKLRGL